MVTTDLVINTVNALMSRGLEPPEPLQPVAATIPIQPTTSTPTPEAMEHPTNAEDEDDVPPLMPQDEDEESDDEAEDDDEQEEEEAPPTTRRSARIAQGIKPPERYALVTQIQETDKKLNGAVLEEAKWKAIEAEILQIFVELKALLPVMREDIPEDAEILRSFIFLVEKFLANGDFDKVKARVVADGAQQSRELISANRDDWITSVHEA
jgi:hypothetical protein